MTAHSRRWLRPALGAGFLVPCLSTLALLAGPGQSAFAETRGYAISMIHTATYGDKDTCPTGGNGGNAEIKIRRMVADGMSLEEATKIVKSAGDDQANDAVPQTARRPGQGGGGGGGGARPA